MIFFFLKHNSQFKSSHLFKLLIKLEVKVMFGGLFVEQFSLSNHSVNLPFLMAKNGFNHNLCLKTREKQICLLKTVSVYRYL